MANMALWWALTLNGTLQWQVNKSNTHFSCKGERPWERPRLGETEISHRLCSIFSASCGCCVKTTLLAFMLLTDAPVVLHDCRLQVILLFFLHLALLDCANCSTGWQSLTAYCALLVSESHLHVSYHFSPLNTGKCLVFIVSMLSGWGW